MVDDKLKIRLDLTGCSLPPIEVNREDEYYYRLAAKEIPKVLARYKEVYNELTDKEHYYMALIHFAANMFCQIDRNETKPFIDEMNKASSLIEQRLKAGK